MNTVTLDAVLRRLPATVGGIHAANIQLSKPFLEVVRHYCGADGTVALMSGGAQDCARYNLLGVDPWLKVTYRQQQVRIFHGDECFDVDADPFDVTEQILSRYRLSNSRPDLPFAAGLLGYLSYDLKDRLEVLPRTSVNDLMLPDLYLVAPSLLLIHDTWTDSAHLVLPELEGGMDVRERIARFTREIELPSPPPGWFGTRGGSMASGFSRKEYMAAVGAVRDYIARGHVYQVNMSQRFQVAFQGDPFALYSHLYADNPAAFFAYVNAGDHQIISTSPERFLLQNGRAVETRPIKGTRARGKTPEDDDLARQALLGSPKDDAELSMIVDLMRNDIGKVCVAGSVHVAEHKRAEGYKNVHHLISIVRGTLDPDRTSIDLVRATFPGGSITGCPKIRSMEIIDELEPVRRHIYTGSIGYISFHDTMDLSIAIRTATVCNDRLYFSVGGGVVYDSVPSDEFEETLHKGRTLMRAFELSAAASQPPPVQSIAWCNGHFRPMDDLKIRVDQQGLHYGYGFFETIRVQHSRALLLEEHLRRFERAWRAFFDTPVPDITWDEVIRQVVERCGLNERVAAVKILAAAGKMDRNPLGGTLLVTAREYTERLSALERKGLRLVTYPLRRHFPLSEHKTNNYMFCKLAGQWAVENTGDEALILNTEGLVSETNTANVFCIFSGEICQPSASQALPGVMQAEVGKLLSTWGRPVTQRRISLDELKQADAVFLTNSLMGAVAAMSIDGRRLGDASDLCTRINEVLLS